MEAKEVGPLGHQKWAAKAEGEIHPSSSLSFILKYFKFLCLCKDYFEVVLININSTKSCWCVMPTIVPGTVLNVFLLRWSHWILSQVLLLSAFYRWRNIRWWFKIMFLRGVGRSWEWAGAGGWGARLQDQIPNLNRALTLLSVLLVRHIWKQSFQGRVTRCDG